MVGSAVLFVAAAFAALLGGPLGLVLAGLLMGVFHTGPVIEGPPPRTSLPPAWIVAWLVLPYTLQFGLLLPDPAGRERMLAGSTTTGSHRRTTRAAFSTKRCDCRAKSGSS